MRSRRGTGTAWRVIGIVWLVLLGTAGAATGRTATREHRPKPPPVTVPSVLAKLAASGQITDAVARQDTRAWTAALAEERGLSRPRAAELASVTVLLHDLAAAGQMTATRLPELFATLAANASYWPHGAMLGYGDRVSVPGSLLVWQYYPGAGLELQVLGTFGEANGFYEAGRSEWTKLEQVIAEMLPLAVTRGGGLAWEYDFPWEGTTTPWVSAMAEGTAIEALTNAYLATHDRAYLADAHSALGILETGPPTGVAVPTAAGTRFLQYSFAPSTDILNAFLQTLIGLLGYARVAQDPTAQALLAHGNAQALAELPSFDTGAWSLYQPGVPDDLGYHQLVTGFLQTLCTLTRTSAYCTTAQHFTADETTPPTLKVVTAHATRNRPARIYFTLDKPARVGVVVTTRGGHRVLATSAPCQPGTDFWLTPRLGRGSYTIALSGTDLAGNSATASGTLAVS